MLSVAVYYWWLVIVVAGERCKANRRQKGRKERRQARLRGDNPNSTASSLGAFGSRSQSFFGNANDAHALRRDAGRGEARTSDKSYVHTSGLNFA